MTSLTSFNLFPTLPHELRLQIWEVALPDPRILYIRETSIPHPTLKRTSQRDTKIATAKEYWVLSAPLSTPSLLLVNHESFSIASRHYELAFPGAKDVQYPHTLCARTWIDFKRDTVYIGSETFKARNLSEFSPAHRGVFLGPLRDEEKIINLAIQAEEFLGLDRYGFHNNIDNYYYTWITLLSYRGVKRLYVVVDHVVLPQYDHLCTKAEAEELAFVELPGAEHISISGTLKLFDHPQPWWTWDDLPLFDDTDFYIDMEDLRAKFYSSRRPNESDWDLPDIRQRVVCSAAVLKILMQKVEKHCPSILENKKA